MRLSSDEVAIAGPIENWEHLIVVYTNLAEIYPEHEEGWLDMATWISSSLAEARAEIEQQQSDVWYDD